MAAITAEFTGDEPAESCAEARHRGVAVEELAPDGLVEGTATGRQERGSKIQAGEVVQGLLRNFSFLIMVGP
jgi:hypothetical protein